MQSVLPATSCTLVEAHNTPKVTRIEKRCMMIMILMMMNRGPPLSIVEYCGRQAGSAVVKRMPFGQSNNRKWRRLRDSLLGRRSPVGRIICARYNSTGTVTTENENPVHTVFWIGRESFSRSQSPRNLVLPARECGTSPVLACPAKIVLSRNTNRSHVLLQSPNFM